MYLNIKIKNLKLFRSDNCIMVDNYYINKPFEVWNCPSTGISKNSNSIGVWKIKQLKQ